MDTGTKELQREFLCPSSPEDGFIAVVAISLEGDGVEVDEISRSKTPRQRPLSRGSGTGNLVNWAITHTRIWIPKISKLLVFVALCALQ